jgi:putative hydrolase of the HAD superfamily
VAITAVICDFGGVLTTPLLGSFMAFQNETGISAEALGAAMERIAEADGEHPLFELERGRASEADFLERMAGALEPEPGHRPEMHRFSEIYFEALRPNEPMIELMRGLRGRGYRMALLTNNVREWEPLWRSMLPVDEIFELVVDSAFVGMRKPEREIYRLTVQRLGEASADGSRPAPSECLFVDDSDVNVEAARELGMTAIHFRDNEQAVAEIEEALTAGRPGEGR